MRRLIVNADDFGIHAARNQGVAEAVRAGVVTSVSLIANLEGFDDAVALLRSLPPVDVGLHFNLSEGRPLTEAHRTLVGPDGCFPGKVEARLRAVERLLEPAKAVDVFGAQLAPLRVAAGQLYAAEIVMEYAAQRIRLVQAGLEPTHVDGHQHIHVYGAVTETLLTCLCPSHWTRLPSEPDDPSADPPPARRAQIDEYRDLAERARGRFAAAGLRTADHFRGLALSGRMTPEGLAELVRGLPDGVTELMVHPGRRAEGTTFDGADREAELEALLSPEFRRALDEGGVELIRRGQVA